MRQKLQQAQLSVLDTPFAREQEVESGRADVFMTDYPYSRRMLARPPDWARLVAPSTTYHITPTTPTSWHWAMIAGIAEWNSSLLR